MTLFPLEVEELKIRSFPSVAQNHFTLDYAMKHDVTSLLAEQIESYSELEKGQVINIYGNDKTGKTTVVKSLSQIIKQQTDYSICVTFDFEHAHQELEEKDIIIIEPGEKIKSYQDKSDTYGLEQIRNACNNKKAIALIVSDKKLIDKENRADFYLKTELFDKDQETNTCILEIDSFCLGYVEIYKIDNEKIDTAYAAAKEEFLKSEIHRIYENITDSTKEFLGEILIPRKIIFSKKKNELRKTENAIIAFKTIVIGDQGSGKTTFTEIFNELLDNYYKEKNVHAVMHKDKLTGLLMYGFEKKFVNLLVSNDFTYNTSNIFDLKQFIRVRHLMLEKTKFQQALTYIMLNLHQLSGKGSERGFRLFIDLFILLTYPTDSWTRDYFKKYCPEIYLEFLKHNDKLKKEAKKRGNKDEWNRLKGFGVAVGRGYILPFYLNTADYPVKEIPELLLPEEPEEKVTEWENWEIEIIDKSSLQLAAEHNPFGYKNLIPRLDPDICEGFLLEQYPKIRNLNPKRRIQLAKEVFALAKYHAWKDIDEHESVLESTWSSDWENYVNLILEKIAGEYRSPTAAVLDAMIDEIDQEKYETIRRSSYAGKNYRTMIKNRIKKFFHTRIQNTVRKKELKDRVGYDPNHWKMLRNIFKQFFIEMGVTESYARICTSMILWREEREIPKEGSLEDMPLTKIISEWSDEIKDRGPIDMAKTRYHKESYEFYRCWENLSTKEIGEIIGEQYAFKILENACSNLTSFPSRSVRDTWFLEFADPSLNNPFDLALFSSSPGSNPVAADQTALAIFNVKTLTKKNPGSEKRFGFGMDHPGVKVFWTIETRPFKETIKAKGGALGSNFKETTLDELLEELSEGEKNV